MKIVAVLLSLLYLQNALGQNPNVKRIAEKTFAVGIFERPFRTERIIQPNEYSDVVGVTDLDRDWAACIVMCLNYDGLDVSQEQIVNLVSGPAQNLMLAINKTSPRAWGRPSKIYCSGASLDADVIFDELSAGRPVMVGTSGGAVDGRAFVLTTMTYTINYDADGKQTGITPANIVLRDPWPQGLYNRTITWADFVILNAQLYTIKVKFQ